MSAPINLSSRVRAVTVYRVGALVTREAELVRTGDSFPARVQLFGLPLTLDDSSMRVEIACKGDQPGPIAGDLRVSIAVPDNDAELEPPSNEELDRAQLDLDLAQEALEQLQHAKNRVAALQPVPRGRPEEGKPPASSPTAARLELLSFRREHVERLTSEIEAASERVRLASEHLETMRERERVAASQRNARTYELRKAAVLELDRTEGSELAERVIVRLHYFVPGARWAPAYTVRLDRAMRAGSLELRAMVGQATGEDWRDVALTLSTAVPQNWTELPELRSRRIGRRQPPPQKTGWRPPPVGATELYADFDRGLGDDGQAESDGDLSDLDDEEPDIEQLLREETSSQANRQRLEQQQRPPSGPPLQFGGPPNTGAIPAQSMTRAGMAPPQGMPMPSAPPAMHAPAPGAYPMPMAAPKRSSGGLGAMVGGALGGLASAFSSDEGYAGGGGAPFMPEPEPELVAGRDLLDYGRLRLFPCTSPHRGSLRRIDLRMAYQQTSVTSIRIDVAISQIREAVEWARLLETEQPPEHHHWATSEAGFDYAYVAEAPIDLPSKGAFVSLPIDLREAEATPRYITVPRETQDVFRIVALRNPLAAPLLPGPADVYVGGKFALTSNLELTPVGGRIELGLGVEQSIKVARNVSFVEDSSGMFKRQLALSHTIKVEIQNHMSSPAVVEVRERTPIAAQAQAEDIAVVVEQVTPKWEDYEPDRPGVPKLEGGRVWKVEVPAAGKRELSATWVVKIPSNHEVIGGNRRES
jgi:hypothetical protein